MFIYDDLNIIANTGTFIDEHNCHEVVASPSKVS